jgi:hypothetical protein
MVTLTLTSVKNVDYDKGTVIDPEQIFTKQCSDDEILTVFNTELNKHFDVKPIALSLFHHRLVLADEQHHILHMLTKEEETNGKL